MRMLIIEDNQEIAGALKDGLEQESFCGRYCIHR